MNFWTQEDKDGNARQCKRCKDRLRNNHFKIITINEVTEKHPHGTYLDNYYLCDVCYAITLGGLK